MSRTHSSTTREVAHARVSLVSLGCSKNLVDSEGIVSDLISRGIDVVSEPAESDVALINTCGFLGSARAESLGTIREICALKESGDLRGVIVTGCMVGNYAELIDREAPGVDRLVDFADYAAIPEIVAAFLPQTETGAVSTRPGRRVQARLTPAHYAYLKISEGCNHTCSFCVIPRIRGRLKSVPIEDLVRRTRRYAAIGAREIVIIAQDSTMYGSDLYGRMRLPDLLREVSAVDGIRWVRLLYAYPTEVSDELLALMAAANPILPYIDVPIQHTTDRMLNLMNRLTSAADVENVMRRIRAQVPESVIRTTLIVGFPGETDDDFEHMLDFVRRHRIDRLGAFPYSNEPGSAAASLPDPVPPEVRAERLDRLMSLQREIALESQKRQVGRVVDVLVEDPVEDGGVIGRTAMDAPEIDGKIRVEGVRAAPGEFVRAEITAATAYDFEARAVKD